MTQGRSGGGQSGALGGDVAAGSWQQGSAAATKIRQLLTTSTRVDTVAALSGHVLDALDAGSAHWLAIRTARSDRDRTPSDRTGSDPTSNDSSGRAESGSGPTRRNPIVSADSSTDPTDDSTGLIGVAVAIGDDPAEVVVAPDARGRGHGSWLVRAAVDRQGAVWAYGDLPAAGAVARRLGLRPGRVLLQLRRTLAGRGGAAQQAGPDINLPPGVRLRTFVPGQDDAAFLDVNARAFAWHPEQGRLDQAGLRAEMAEDWFDPAGFFLAVTDDAALAATGERLLGFHWTKVHRRDPTPGASGGQAPVGEVYVLGVDPRSGVRGLGAPLTAIGLDHLARQGLDTVMLYVEGDNERALRLYRRFGFVDYLTNVVYRRPPTG